MFDFFLEIADNASQYVTVFNWAFDVIDSVITEIKTNDAMQMFFQTVQGFPAPLVPLFLSVFSVAVFDFVRGR